MLFSQAESILKWKNTEWAAYFQTKNIVDDLERRREKDRIRDAAHKVVNSNSRSDAAPGGTRSVSEKPSPDLNKSLSAGIGLLRKIRSHNWVLMEVANAQNCTLPLDPPLQRNPGRFVWSYNDDNTIVCSTSTGTWKAILKHVIPTDSGNEPDVLQFIFEKPIDLVGVSGVTWVLWKSLGINAVLTLLKNYFH